MNRFHVHLNVADLDTSIAFYTQLFATQPAVRKPDYAKWMLEDPRINFAISNTGRPPGIDHLGVQVDSAEELAALGERLKAAGGTIVPEDAAVCCYAQSDKLWTHDPQGTRWESFHTVGEATSYYAVEAPCATDGATCSPDFSAIQAGASQAGAVQASTPQAPAKASASCCAPASGCC